MSPITGPDFIFNLPPELHLHTMKLMPDACALLTMVQSCKLFRKIYMLNSSTILKSVAKNTCPSVGGAVKRALQAACSDGHMIYLVLPPASDSNRVWPYQESQRWTLPEPAKDVWSRDYYQRDSIASLHRLADLTNEVEQLTEWLWNRHDRIEMVGRLEKTKIRAVLWLLQIFSQRVRNLNLKREIPMDDSYEVLDLDSAKERLVQIRESHGVHNELLNNIRRALKDSLHRLHRHQLHPHSYGLIFGDAYAEWIALSRLRQWSLGMTDKEIVTRLASDRSAWRSIKGTIVGLMPALVRHWDITVTRITVPAARGPVPCDNQAFESVCEERENSCFKVDMTGFEDDQELLRAMAVTEDKIALELYLQRLRPLMGLPYGVRPVEMCLLVGESALAPGPQVPQTILARRLNEQVQRNRSAKAKMLEYWRRTGNRAA